MLLARRGQAHHHVGDLLADGGRAGGLAVRAAEHRHVGVGVRHLAQLARSRASSAGSSTCSRAPLSCSAWLVLLMSSLVQAKCTNSLAARSSGRASNLDLIQYSTAFTSWLVVFSISLMASASASEKFFTRPEQVGAGAGRQRLELGKAGVGQRDEPAHLDLHAAVHVALLAHQRAQRRRGGRHSGRPAATARKWWTAVMGTRHCRRALRRDSGAGLSHRCHKRGCLRFSLESPA